MEKVQQLPDAPRREVFPFWPKEFTSAECEMVAYVIESGLTMVSPERLFSLVLSCRWVVENNVPGDFVEAGVWRGGASILTALWLKHHAINDRTVWLFDTFAGMTEPDAGDVRSRDGKTFEQIRVEHDQAGLGDDGVSAYAPLDLVQNNFRKAGLDPDAAVFIVGAVEETLTLEKNLPKSVSLLRLDTDWYKSTLAELTVLYPKLSPNGVLLIDDYGYFEGSRRAVDEYFSANKRPFFLLDDEYGRTGLKPVT